MTVTRTVLANRLIALSKDLREGADLEEVQEELSMLSDEEIEEDDDDGS